MKPEFLWDVFNKIPIVGIMRNIPLDSMEKIAAVYYEAGLGTLEVTMNSQNAEKAITELSSAFSGRLNIGAGTVCSMKDLERALSAGAMFIVTPVLNEEVIKTCVADKVPIFPGAFTPSEIYKAWCLGGDMVKVFPASQFGPGYIKEILAPLNEIKLLPTGGVTTDNFGEYLKAGARGVGIGSNLFPHQFVAGAQWEELKAFFVNVVKKYNLTKK